MLGPPTHLSIKQEHLPEILLHTSHHSEMAARETPCHRSLEEESFLKRLPSPRRFCWCFWPDANLRLNKIQPCQRSACPLHGGQLPMGRDSVVISVCRLWTLNTGLNQCSATLWSLYKKQCLWPQFSRVQLCTLTTWRKSNYLCIGSKCCGKFLSDKNSICGLFGLRNNLWFFLYAKSRQLTM